jgi:hypothetical protein
MNYITQLLQEHSRINTDFMTNAIGNDPVEFKKIIDIIYTQPAPLPQRAAWLLATVNAKHPDLLTPYIPTFIKDVEHFKLDAIKRNMSHVLTHHSIPKKLQGRLVTICFNLLLSPDETVVVKVNAMQCLANMATEHPDLIPELKMAMNDQYPKTTVAFHARAKMILKKLEKIK